MVIFHSYVSLPEGNHRPIRSPLRPIRCPACRVSRKLQREGLYWPRQWPVRATNRFEIEPAGFYSLDENQNQVPKYLFRKKKRNYWNLVRWLYIYYIISLTSASSSLSGVCCLWRFSLILLRVAQWFRRGWLQSDQSHRSKWPSVCQETSSQK